MAQALIITVMDQILTCSKKTLQVLAFRLINLNLHYLIINQVQRSMGIFKIMFFIATPIVGLTIAAFRLNRQLPIASRLFGNYIGLSYVYFKSILKYVKPVDQMPFEMISLARKTSQQSQALRRQLKSTLKRVKEDLSVKKQQTFKQFEDKPYSKQVRESFDSLFAQKQTKQINANQKQQQLDSSRLILSILQNREAILMSKKIKKESRQFFQKL